MQKLKDKLGLNARLSLLIPYFIIAIILIVTPMVFLVVKSASPAGENFDNWKLVKQTSTWKVMWRSVYSGLLAAGITLVIGVPFAYVVATSNNKIFKTLSIALMVSPLFIFTIAKVFAIRGLLLSMFDESKLNNDFVIIIGLSYLNLPYMIIPIYSVFSSMPKSLIEASNDLGYSGVKTMFKVIIPYGLRAILAGTALVFMLAATSIVVSDKLLPDGGQHKLISNIINNHAHPANKFDIAMSSSVALITIVIMTSIYAGIYLLPSLIRKVRGGVNV